MRHLAVGQACPIDGTAVSRVHCSSCPEFVSFRSSGEPATIGCRWGEDVVGWLRREMTNEAVERTPDRVDQGPRRAPVGLGARLSLAIFVAAFGVGLALSAYDRD